MPDKKTDKDAQPDEQKALEQRVDQMMEAGSAPAVSRDVEVPVKVTLPTPKTPTSAPELPKKLEQDIQEEPEPAAPPTPEAEPAEPPTEPIPPQDPASLSKGLDEGSDTDKAVDDISKKESDKLLAIDDALVTRKQKAVSTNSGWKSKLKHLFKNKWTWIILAIIFVALLAAPFTRYKILGLIIKKPVTVSIVDSKTGTAVSNAEITLAGTHGKTDGSGKAHIRAALGKHDLVINKQYYKDYRGQYFVGFKSSKDQTVKLTATGRLVPITVVNKITGQPLSGAEIKVLNTTAKTDKKGKATVALPTTAASDPAKLSLNGYNQANVIIEVTDQPVKANTFELTPAGHIYFLSNLSGNIDVVKSNLDGSGRKTVFEGTGKEDTNTTSLLASRDWRFVVLKSHRDGTQPSLYLIDTTTDKVTNIDGNIGGFDLVGWYGHNFIYSLTRNLSEWQAARQQLKSYDADHLQLNLLDQNQAEGTSASYAYQNFYNFYILNGVVAYNTQWVTYGSGFDVSGKTDSIRAVQPNSQGKKDYQTFASNTIGYVQAALYEPAAVYYSVPDTASGKTSYYVYENQAVKSAQIDSGAFNKTYPTFLVSPTGNKTFWSELRDGKNALFTGDAEAQNKKQIGSLSDYAPYGWFSDNYLLVSKNSSQLYAMPVGGLAKGRQPLKITDYYKPAQTFNGYGYGYGGL